MLFPSRRWQIWTRLRVWRRSTDAFSRGHVIPMARLNTESAESGYARCKAPELVVGQF